MEYYEKIGYLHATHQIFYIEDIPRKDIALHYHDFHKVLMLLGGQTEYYIEGRTYLLKQGDTVLIGAGKLHRPILTQTKQYQRLIVYVSEQYLSGLEDAGLIGIRKLFQSQEYCNADEASFRFAGLLQAEYRHMENTSAVGSALYRDSLLQCLLVHLTRMQEQRSQTSYDSALFTDGHPIILAAQHYINANLTESLSIDSIAKALFLSRSYLMHLFQKETGDTINHYIINKRLFLAHSMMEAGEKTLTDIAYTCGFHSYTAFYRAFKEKYKETPRVRGSSQTRGECK